MDTVLLAVRHLAESGDQGSPIAIIVITPIVVAVLTYWLVYRYYRNANARFQYEEHTRAEVHELKARDTKVHHRTGLRSSTIAARNDYDATANIPVSSKWPQPRIPDADNPRIQQAVPPLGQPPAEAVPPLGLPPQEAVPPLGQAPQQAPPQQGTLPE